MIVTLTANPSLDRAVTLAEPLRPGEVQTAQSVREDAGGKGINVTRVLLGSGQDSVAVLPLDADDQFAVVLRAAGVPLRPVAAHGAARANLTIADPSGVTTKINLPGVTRSREDGDALIAAVAAAAAGARWLVLAGSLPPGLPDDFYVDVIRAVRANADAPRIAVDTSGAALRAVVAAGAPDLIKPNDDELVELTGAPLDASIPLPQAVAAAGRALVPDRVGAAFVTLGGAGAVLVTPDGAWQGTPPPTRVRSTVGAGDSSLAGFLLAEASGGEPEECLRSGIRYGSAAAALPGTQAPTPADLLPGDVPVSALTH
ncbi:MAG: 1-phosphofructokinase [Microbacterium sp. SCN 70-200]|uniref:1-phosphofructokinase n=1 Tax=unclassified Microbacterium TaxID=2609290 RepID=UPI00086ACCB7|nr:MULTISPECIES: 1-phosphofructokinase [unclassified Microbacterium]MBN9214436.1 1-phosphofructokinase [Microbacterium sp.]ODT40768.1 MAG: 1-phosphofructokinase [Microbacterium sp. SCN 70-200]OJV83766.1 MAG: 1-phosphofructokinase [Microbacterium sp. 70-16]